MKGFYIMPKKLSTKVISIYVSEEFHDWLIAQSEEHEESLSKFIIRKSGLKQEYRLHLNKLAAQESDNEVTAIRKSKIKFE
jgi:hypothetical protein